MSPRSVRSVRSAERGSAAVLATVLLGVLAVSAVLCSTVAGALVDRRRADAAADLAALAGAAAGQDGRDPCAAAGAAARSNHARLSACRVVGEVVTVRVQRDVPGALSRVLGRRLTVTGAARAGPVDAAPGAAGQRVGAGGSW